MNAEQVAVMQAGRAMDALVAEHVMGWKSVTFRRTADNTLTGVSPDGQIDDVPGYSVDIWAAWPIVERMKAASPYKFWFELSWRPIGYACNFVGDHYHMVYAETGPLAICRAALKAIAA